ncbi:hypothetical protein HZC09_06290, partial [Candidatus Micrarchaeota archaeon]|nr:hypothetical protein [Candidatus Micrarchaeota archaeon]
MTSFFEAKKTERMEEELPLFLLLCSFTSSFQSFEKTLSSCSSGFTELGPQFRRVVGDVAAGKTVHAALTSFSSRIPSLSIKRACAQLCFSYSHGDSSGLRALAKEFEQLERKKWKDFAS